MVLESLELLGQAAEHEVSNCFGGCLGTLPRLGDRVLVAKAEGK